MLTVAIALGAAVFYVLAYYTYGRWLARKIFNLDPNARTPAETLRDDVDFVPSRAPIVFGHHFTSIAGTGPIVGPAIAVIWGWLPALLWVLLGSVLMGAVHDFGALVMSLRNRGFSIGWLTEFVIGRRARLLFLTVVFFELWIVVAIFGLVIAAIFAIYPCSVLPVWIQIPIAIALGLFLVRAKRARGVLIASCVAVAVMYLTIAWGSASPVRLGAFLGRPPTFWWSVILFGYAFIASVLPVQVLLQPRDFINAFQLFIAMALLFAGILVASPPLVAPATQTAFVGAESHPFFPFLFITVACGAISGFHSLVGSGTSSKQLARETDAQAVGFGAMLTEGMLAVLVILAACAGLGMKYDLTLKIPAAPLAALERQDPTLKAYALESADVLGLPASEAARTPLPKPVATRARHEELNAGTRDPLDEIEGFRGRHPEARLTGRTTPAGDRVYSGSLAGREAWGEHYRSWDSADKGLRPKLRAFVDGAANLMGSLGISIPLGLAIMGVFVASFAGTTLDTATRLQRYVVSEFGRVSGVDFLRNRYAATGVAVATAAGLALWDGKGGGAMVLWPLFGALNQLLASLGLLVLAIYLYRHRKPMIIAALPFVFMLVVTAWAMALNVKIFYAGGRFGLLAITAIVLALQIWMVVEAVIIWRRLSQERARESARQ